MSSRSMLVGLVFACATWSCLDPLYEDGFPVASSWVVCCQQGTVSTCACGAPATCQQTIFPCPGGRCAATRACFGGTGGTGGSGGSGFQDAGTGTGGSGGTGTGGGSSVGGGAGGGSSVGGGAGGGSSSSDAGSTVDGGSTGGGAGGGTGGGATGGGSGGGFEVGGGQGGGVSPINTTYVFCCPAGRVTTCACPSAECVGQVFTACPNGACVAGSTTARCF